MNSENENIMKQKVRKAAERKQRGKDEQRKKKIKGRENLDFDLKEHEHPSKTLTPKRHHHPFSWWLKWASSIVLVFAMIGTTNDMYPWNMFLQFLGCLGWLWVSVIWNDRALIIVNAVAVAIFLNGIFIYFIKG